MENRCRYKWKNNEKRKTLAGRSCRVVIRGKRNSALVEFENGQRENVSRNALEKTEVCPVCGVPGCAEARGPNFHKGPRFASLTCDYRGRPPFADAEWAKEKDAPCLWCAGTGHPYGDESYSMCACPENTERHTRYPNEKCGEGFPNSDPDCVVHRCGLREGHKGITHHCANCGVYFSKSNTGRD